jgi:hypothetical protein
MGNKSEALGAIRLKLKRGWKAERSVRKNVGGVVPRFTIRAAGPVFRCEIDTGESGPERALFGLGCDQTTVVKSEMSAHGRHVGQAGGIGIPMT